MIQNVDANFGSRFWIPHLQVFLLHGLVVWMPILAETATREWLRLAIQWRREHPGNPSSLAVTDRRSSQQARLGPTLAIAVAELLAHIVVCVPLVTRSAAGLLCMPRARDRLRQGPQGVPCPGQGDRGAGRLQRHRAGRVVLHCRGLWPKP